MTSPHQIDVHHHPSPPSYLTSHSVASNCCRGILPELMDALIEYGTDTSRAIANLPVTG